MSNTKKVIVRTVDTTRNSESASYIFWSATEPAEGIALHKNIELNSDIPAGKLIKVIGE
jgi:hypothetical protein